MFWIGSKDGKYAMSWNEFAAIADITYDAGYGGQEIASDLVVVGNNWWLERYEYDGSECWEFKTPPLIQVHPKKFTILKGSSWEELHYLNKENT